MVISNGIIVTIQSAAGIITPISVGLRKFGVPRRYTLVYYIVTCKSKQLMLQAAIVKH